MKKAKGVQRESPCSRFDHMVKKEPANVEISDVVILTTWQNKLKSLYYKLFHHVVVLTTLIITVYIIYNYI